MHEYTINVHAYIPRHKNKQNNKKKINVLQKAIIPVFPLTGLVVCRT